MSHVVDHVNEAQLHAYLDRDLEFADPEVHKAMGAHIADCSKCSSLLKEVRRVYESSNQLLDVSAPPARPAPSFDDIVKRAAARQSGAFDAELGNSRFLRSNDQPPAEQADELEVELDPVEPAEITAEADEDDIVFIESVDTGDADDDEIETFFPEEPVSSSVEDDQPVVETIQPSADDSEEAEDEVTEPMLVLPDLPADIEPEPIAEATGDAGDADETDPMIEIPDQVHQSAASSTPQVDIPSAEEVVFIDAETPVVPQEPEPVEPAPQVAQKAKKQGRTTRILALAATIVVAVGVGGWFGRPYIIERLGGGAPATVALSESREADQATRQELQNNQALNAPGDARILAADSPGEPDATRTDSTGASFEQDPLQAREAAESELGGVASGFAPSVAARTIVGNVRDSQSKEAVPGARVELRGTDLVARTDASGRFEITDVPAGSVNIDVLGSGYERSEKGIEVSDSLGTVADFELRRSLALADEIVAPTTAARTRAVAAPAPRDQAVSNDDSGWTETTRTQAETVLGGPLVSIEGLDIDRIERVQGQTAIRVTQTARNGNPVYLQIVSSGTIGADATLESARVTSPDGTMPATGIVVYGGYEIDVEALVSAIELESLLRRITVTPNLN